LLLWLISGRRSGAFLFDLLKFVLKLQQLIILLLHLLFVLELVSRLLIMLKLQLLGQQLVRLSLVLQLQ
jgi:hypothetical protein